MLAAKPQAAMPNSGRSRTPSHFPGNAAANQTSPCRLPEETPPTKAPTLQPKRTAAPPPPSAPPPSAAAAAPCHPIAVPCRSRPSSAALAQSTVQNSVPARVQPRLCARFAPQRVSPMVTPQGGRGRRSGCLLTGRPARRRDGAGRPLGRACGGPCHGCSRRAREGIAWINRLEPHMAGGSNFCRHLHWHRALFHLGGERTGGGARAL